MSEPGPEELARLLSLPADHPERVRAGQDPRFEAWRLMLREFESSDAPHVSRDEAAWAAAALEARLEPALAPRPARRERTGRSPAQRERARGWLAPAWRPALALAAVVAIAGGVWWARSRLPATSEVRGAPGAALEWREPLARGGSLRLEWTPVPGARSYRLRFYRSDLTEIARVEDITGVSYTLQADALPPGLERGAEVVAEITAMTGGEAVAVSKARALRLP
jgi:hypothetical protein